MVSQSTSTNYVYTTAYLSNYQQHSNIIARYVLPFDGQSSQNKMIPNNSQIQFLHSEKSHTSKRLVEQSYKQYLTIPIKIRGLAHCSSSVIDLQSMSNCTVLRATMNFGII